MGDFLEDFNKKCFLGKVIDHMERKFQDIHQGTGTVREYGEDFNYLRRFVGHHVGEREMIHNF